MKYCLRTIMVAVLLGAAGCATTPYNPFKVSRAEILANFKTVAVASIAIPNNLPNSEQTKTDFESLVADQLKAIGFQVVPASDYKAIYFKMREELGGFYDPLTGKADEEKIKKVADLSRRELAAKHKADAVLYSAVVVVSAAFQGQMARWDGVHEQSTTGNFWSKVLWGDRSGTMSALSLRVALSDINGKIMFVNFGGLQLLSKFNAGSFVTVPDQDLLINPQLKTNAAAIAFEPLREDLEKKKRERPKRL